MIHQNEVDEYIVSESELADAARLEGVPEEVLEVLYACDGVWDDPAAPVGEPAEQPKSTAPDDFFEYFASAKLQERHTRPVTEITTLMRNIDQAHERRAADAELGAHLNDGWQVLDLTVTTNIDLKLIRVVTLQRECPPQPITTPPPTEAGTSIPLFFMYGSDYDMAEKDGVTITLHETVSLSSRPTVIITPPERPANPALAKLLADHPIAAHIHKHGIEDTLDIMNQQAAEAGRAAYEQRLDAHQRRPFTPAPLLPR